MEFLRQSLRAGSGHLRLPVELQPCYENLLIFKPIVVIVVELQPPSVAA